jgi:DNA-binding Xre family transcriptional regulator
MLVHVKTPPIEVEINGKGADILLKTLRTMYADLEVSDDDEAIPVESDPWFQKLRASRTSGEVLACYRDNARITLDELSERSGIAKSHLSEMENNKRPIGLKTAKKLAEALSCDFHRFLVA